MGLPDSTPLEVIQEHPQVLVWSLPPDAGADVCEEVRRPLCTQRTPPLCS